MLNIGEGIVAVDPTVMSSRLWNSMVLGRDGHKVVAVVRCEQAVEE
jgi:hypothetical protein